MKKVLMALVFLAGLSTIVLADPVLTRLSPNYGSPGVGIIITGEGFSPTNNTIIFTDQSQGMIYRTKIKADSEDLKNLKFKVPFALDPLCSEEDPPCAAPSKEITYGTFYINVVDAEGQESNSLRFEIYQPCSCERNVSGTVTDQQGNPVMGISIYELGQFQDVTDENGQYSYRAPGTANAPHCPLGDTYIYVKKDEEILTERFVPVTCGNYTYDFTVKLLPVSPELLGDVNGDGILTIVDALLIVQYYLGLPVNIDKSVADVNCDGEITIVDALLVAQRYVGLLKNLGC